MVTAFCTKSRKAMSRFWKKKNWYHFIQFRSAMNCIEIFQLTQMWRHFFRQTKQKNSSDWKKYFIGFENIQAVSPSSWIPSRFSHFLNIDTRRDRVSESSQKTFKSTKSGANCFSMRSESHSWILNVFLRKRYLVAKENTWKVKNYSLLQWITNGMK